MALFCRVTEKCPKEHAQRNLWFLWVHLPLRSSVSFGNTRIGFMVARSATVSHAAGAARS